MPEIPLKPYREKKPWGDYEKFTENQKSTVKILTINPGEAFSLQHHANRDEFWHVLSGKGTFIIGEEKVEAVVGEDYFIPRGTNHRIEAGDEKVVVLQISLGDFNEEDIVRLEDKYGRV